MAAERRNYWGQKAGDGTGEGEGEDGPLPLRESKGSTTLETIWSKSCILVSFR